MNAPVLIMVEHGPQMRLELFDLYARKVFGGRDLTGKRLLDVLPELQQRLSEIAQVVRTVVRVGVDEALTLDWSGSRTPETRCMTLVCQPLLGHCGAVDGSVTFAIDVTSNVLARALHHATATGLEDALDNIATL